MHNKISHKYENTALSCSLLYHQILPNRSAKGVGDKGRRSEIAITLCTRFVFRSIHDSIPNLSPTNKSEQSQVNVAASGEGNIDDAVVDVEHFNVEDEQESAILTEIEREEYQ